LDAATGVSYHYGFTANQLPYFILNPGPYYIETRADDGTKFTDQGTDYFMTCFPNYLSLHIGGPSPENCNVLRAIVDMYDEAEKSIKNITLHGNLYKFDSFEEMNSWLDNHPQVNYLESPELIPF
ncbi:MAG: hypothetical protein ACOC10_03070, partial [Bacteroidota bacterium]